MISGTLLVAGGIVDHVLDSLDAHEHVHAMKDRPSIAKTGKHLRMKEGRLVSRVVRAFSDAPDDRAGLEAVFAVARPGRKFGPSSSGIAAELLGECLVAADAVLGIWLRRHGEKEPAPETQNDAPEPAPMDARVAAILFRKEAAPSDEIDLSVLTAVDELRDQAASIRQGVTGSRGVGLDVVVHVLRLIATKRTTGEQEAVIDRLWAALLADGAEVVRPLPARPWLTTAELGDVLGLADRKTVVRWLEARNVPIQQPGKNIRVLVTDLQKSARGEWSAARKLYEKG